MTPLQTLSLDDLATATGGRHAPPRRLPPTQPGDPTATPGAALDGDPAPSAGRTASSYRQPLRLRL